MGGTSCCGDTRVELGGKCTAGSHTGGKSIGECGGDEAGGDTGDCSSEDTGDEGGDSTGHSHVDSGACTGGDTGEPRPLLPSPSGAHCV